MGRRLQVILYLFILVHFSIFTTALHAAPERELVAHPLNGKTPLIDGRLDEIWLDASLTGEFVQVAPNEGAPVSFPTYISLMYDPEALYVIFICEDPCPDSIQGLVDRRDHLGESDAVYFNLDSFNDDRNGYYFGVNAAGVQEDGTWYNENYLSDSWDGVWESAVGIDEKGWIAEMRIPFNTFRHGEGETGWGANFGRVICRVNEWSVWQPVDRQRGQRVSEFGLITNLQGIRAGLRMEILPHAVGRWDGNGNANFESKNTLDNLGIDVKLIPSSAWTVDITAQPDFAQVDVDDEEINLSDYPIYLDEKRPFFLEGLSLFDEAPMELIYTRKITDPKMGARVTGQWGNTRSSFLVTQNEAEDHITQDVVAGRTVYQFPGGSRIGFTGTTLQEDYFHASSGMVDTRLRWSEENYFDCAVAGLDKSGAEEQPFSGNYEFYVTKGAWRVGQGGHYRGKDFDINDLGWTGYSRVMGQWFWAQHVIFPEGGSIEAFRGNINLYHEAMPDGSLYERSGNFNFGISTRSNYYYSFGMNWGAGFYRERDTDDDSTSILKQDNFGDFRPEWHPWYNRWVYMSTDERKPVSLELDADQGTFREGQKWGGGVEAEFRIRQNIEPALSMRYIHVEGAQRTNDGAPADFYVYRLRTRYNPTLHLTLRGTIQYVVDGSSMDDSELLSNFLIAWNWHPGSWFYIVYDENRLTDFAEDWHKGDRTIRMKWTYFFAM